MVLKIIIVFCCFITIVSQALAGDNLTISLSIYSDHDPPAIKEHKKFLLYMLGNELKEKTNLDKIKNKDPDTGQYANGRTNSLDPIDSGIHDWITKNKETRYFLVGKYVEISDRIWALFWKAVDLGHDRDQWEDYIVGSIDLKIHEKQGWGVEHYEGHSSKIVEALLNKEKELRERGKRKLRISCFFLYHDHTRVTSVNTDVKNSIKLVEELSASLPSGLLSNWGPNFRSRYKCSALSMWEVPYTCKIDGIEHKNEIEKSMVNEDYLLFGKISLDATGRILVEAWVRTKHHRFDRPLGRWLHDISDKESLLKYFAGKIHESWSQTEAKMQ